jgi:hypothetical protein
VLSWVDDDRSGYEYPEVAGYLLTSLRLTGPATDPLAGRVAARLVDLVGRGEGGVGRGGRIYLFDTAIALTGLLTHRHARDWRAETGVIDDAARLVCAMVEAGSAHRGPEPDLRWSTFFGPHLLKVLIALRRYEAQDPRHPTAQAADALVERLLPYFRRGRFRTHPMIDETYVHAHCYAVEGLLSDGRWDTIVLPAVDELGAAQSDSGGLHAWLGPDGPYGPLRADATAQAVRLWTAVDPDRYRRQVTGALDYLSQCTDRSGAVRYTRLSPHLNTWATIFAVQARRWCDGRPAGEDVI